MLVVFGTCTACFILGLSMVTKGGIDMLKLIRNATFSWNHLFIALLEIVVVGWIYGAYRLWDNVEEMGITRHPLIKWYWIICWKFITPLILIILVVVTFVDKVENEETWQNGTIRWLIALTSVGIIPGFAIHEVIKRYRNNEELGVSLFSRIGSWQ